MASVNNLYYVLSAEDASLFASLQANAMLPSLADPGQGELAELYKQRKREEEAEALNPYTDLLEIEIKERVQARKEEILKQLKESQGSIFTADIFSWNTVYHLESLKDKSRRLSAMTPQEVQEYVKKETQRNQQIKINGWESTFGVKYFQTYGSCWLYYPKKVDRIFRKTDLSNRISLALGPNFFPGIRWDHIEGAGEDSETGFSVYKKTLFVRYYPFGVNPTQMMKLLATAKKDMERKAKDEKVTYKMQHFPVFEALVKEEEDGAAIACSCGCEDPRLSRISRESDVEDYY